MNGIVRRRKQEKAEWKASCPSVEELLCLQLSGYSSRQIVGMGIEGNGQLKETAAKAQREMDKARRILDRQAKAGVITVPYYADNYPWHFNNLCNDAPALIHVSGDLGLLNRDDTVAVIGARGADAEGLGVAYRFAGQAGGRGMWSSADWHWGAMRLPIGAVSMRRGRLSPSLPRDWTSLILR